MRCKRSFILKANKNKNKLRDNNQMEKTTV